MNSEPEQDKTSPTKKSWAEFFARLRPSASLLQVVLAIVGCLFLLWVVFWVFEKVFAYYIARSYVDKIAEAFDLNKYLASAIVYLTFVAIVVFAGMIFRRSRQIRRVGMLGLIGLLVAYSLVMWWGTNGPIDPTGRALKCYVITRSGVTYRNIEHAGIDPETGRQCLPVKPADIPRLTAYEKGKRPERISDPNPVFFDTGTGDPIVWYDKTKEGNIQLFNLMGFDPQTGGALLPVTAEIRDAWNLQESRRPPQRIDPNTYPFFDPVTGKPRVWYKRNDDGSFEFYDRSGFDGFTGQPYILVTRDVIEAWLRELRAKKCYIITRTSVIYSEKPGLDPKTGRQCRPVTDKIVLRLREYEKGKRPKPVEEGTEPTFFDPATGEPILWYHKDKSGDIRLFDLMGFDPETGDELQPVNRETVDLWKDQRTKPQVPQRVDPDNYAFFDPVTGRPRVWFWRSESGEYEFYSSPGYQPRTGEKLLVINNDVIRSWKLQEQQVAKQRAEDEKRREAQQRERAEQMEKEKNAGTVCDQLAANPDDRGKPPGVPGTSYDSLRVQASQAIDACTIAVQQNPEELRYQYQLARALEFGDPDKALSVQLKLEGLGYAAAYDNAGGIYLRKQNYEAAVAQFNSGVQNGDPDAMVSLAEMIKKGYAEGDYLGLLERAARLGHEGAQEELQEEQQQELRTQQQQQMQIEAQRRAMELFGTILRSIPAR